MQQSLVFAKFDDFLQRNHSNNIEKNVYKKTNPFFKKIIPLKFIHFNMSWIIQVLPVYH